MSPPKNSRAGYTTRDTILALMLVTLVTFVAYARTVSFEFVYDDHVQIVDQRGVTNAPWSTVWTRDEWSHIAGTGSHYYRPMMGLWRKTNHELFDVNPMGWHFASVVVHLIATLLVFGLALHILKDVFSAGVAAVIFGVHPIHIDSVAWITGVVDPLVGVWMGASFLCYLRANSRRRRLWFGFSGLFFVFALLTKEIALVLPGLVFAHHWFLDEKNRHHLRAALLSAVPFVALSVLYVVFRIWIRGGLLPGSPPADLQTMLLTWPSLLWFYVTHLVFPVGLSQFYDFSHVTRVSLHGVLLPLFGVVVIVAALCAWARREPIAGFAAWWLILPLLPALNLAALPHSNFVHDRFLYVPSMGFALILALAVRALPISRARGFGLPLSHLVPLFTVVTLLSMGTVVQSSQWKNDYELFARGVDIAPASNLARNNLATVLLRDGRIDQAIELYRQVLSNNPKAWRATFNLGQAYYRKGELQAAGRYFEKALFLRPEHGDTYVYLGFTELRSGRPELAEEAFRTAIRLEPERAGYHYALGQALKTQNRLAQALTAFEKELAHESTAAKARAQIEAIESNSSR